jgi:AcrR family transcriptional regulator
MKPERSDSPKYQQQKAAAVRAAATVFAEKGFHGASTRDIAEQLGIKQASLYYYFDSKEEALEDVCLYGLRQYVENMDAIAESDQPFEARLIAVVTNHLASYREKSEALKVHNDERLYLPEQRRTRLKELGSRYRKELEAIFEEGVATGAVRKTIDCHFAALSLIGLCNGLGEHIVRDPDVDVFEQVRKCTDLILNGMKNEE